MREQRTIFMDSCLLCLEEKLGFIQFKMFCLSDKQRRSSPCLKEQSDLGQHCLPLYLH